jgi:hypothetical protein
MFWMVMTALWVVLLVAPLVLLVALLPHGRDCPRCGSETLLIRSRVFGRLRRVLGQRWCTACGWEGLMRYGSRPSPVPAQQAPAEEFGPAADDDAAWRSERDGNPF